MYTGQKKREVNIDLSFLLTSYNCSAYSIYIQIHAACIQIHATCIQIYAAYTRELFIYLLFQYVVLNDLLQHTKTMPSISEGLVFYQRR